MYPEFKLGQMDQGYQRQGRHQTQKQYGPQAAAATPAAEVKRPPGTADLMSKKGTAVHSISFLSLA
jgi:hypothetical protein